MHMSEKNAEKEALARIIAQAGQWSGCDFSRYNEGTMKRRISRRMIDVRCQSMAEYCDYLGRNPSENQSLVSVLTVKVSRFFRDPEVFAFVDSHVLPVLYEQAVRAGRKSMRVWSAACARGEEPYSIAMLLAERDRSGTVTRIATTILATDLDPACLSAASDGIYPAGELEQVPAVLADRYFSNPDLPRPGSRQVSRELRKMVSFATFDLTLADRLSPPCGVFCEYDLIFCRNMFIYCQHSLKLEIMRKLYRSLRSHGFLILGRSESMPEECAGCFKVVNQRLKIFQKEEKI